MANQKNNNHSFEQQLFKAADKLRKKLLRAFILRTGDERISERLTAETMQELGILV